jgi:hypothetical protein
MLAYGQSGVDMIDPRTDWVPTWQMDVDSTEALSAPLCHAM